MSLSLRAYARHRAAKGLPGGTPRAVQVAIRDGRVAKAVTKAGKIRSAAAADAEWLGSTKADMVPLTGPTAPAGREEAPGAAAGSALPVNDLAAARGRRETATAAMAEIELAKTLGELVRASDVEARVGDAFLRCRTKLLGITVRAREADPTITDDHHKLYEGLLHEALEELADGPPG